MDRLRTTFQPGRFRFLLLALLAYCIVGAIYPSSTGTLDALGLVLLVATVVDLQKDETRVIRLTILVIVLLGVAARLMSILSTINMLVVKNLLDVVLAGAVAYAVHAAVVRPNRPADDRVGGAICAYLLIGFAWAAMYSTIEAAHPGSFRTPAEMSTAGSSASFVYYSFVTLTTVGYGDITPITRVAGTFAWMEALTGQLYLAITIASLISVAITERASKKDG